MNDHDDEDGFEIPDGKLVGKGEESHFLYTAFVGLESPKQLHDDVMALCEAHAEEWTETDFSGAVLIQCWNDGVLDDAVPMIQEALDESAEVAGKVIANNQICSADGNPVQVRCVFGNKVIK